MADGGRCLSDLPDDLLRHILFFAPAREGAATAVLSRRWRWLWRTSGAVNLDSRSFKLKHRRLSFHKPPSSDSDDRKRKRSRSTGGSSSNSGRYSAEFLLLRSAEKALAAAKEPIRRLTFFIAEGISEINLTVRRRHRHEEDGSSSASDHNLIETLVSSPAARRVEELRIEVEDVHDTPCTLSLGSLPSEALRVLRIINCSTLTMAAPPPPPPPPAAAAAAFPRLADLHLQGCNVPLEDLQSAIAAAPQLSTLHLQSSYLSVQPAAKTRRDPDERQLDVDRLLVAVGYRFLCPAVTALVFADCRFGFANGRRYGDEVPRLELYLDVPRLEYLRYEGSVQLASRLRLKPRHASNNMIQQVDLHLTSDHRQRSCGREICELFWGFLQSFNTTRRLKLKLDSRRLLMDDLIVVGDDKAIKDALLGSLLFCRLEQLELEAKCEPGKTSMLLLADLLNCCPMVRELRLKFRKVELLLGLIGDKEEEAGVDIDDDDVLKVLEHLNPGVTRWILLANTQIRRRSTK